MVGDACWAPLVGDAQSHHPSLRATADPSGLVVGSAGVITHSGRPVSAVALCPALGRGDADVEAFGGPTQGPAILDDAAGQAQTSGFGQRGITVGHEGLLGVMLCVVATHSTQRPSPVSSHSCL